MIFLGAGASKSFGIKTLQEMSTGLTNFMEKKGHYDIVQEISDKLSRFGLTIDFEAIYTVVEALTNIQESVRKNGPLAAYICRELKKTSNEDFASLLSDFNTFLYEECKLRTGFNDEIASTLDNLFKMVGEANEREIRWVPETNSEAWPQVSIANTVVTTNYDMIMELYWRFRREHYIDGFRATGDPFVKGISLLTFPEKPSSKWLIKLHGSIWMYKCGNNIFKTIDDPKSSSVPVKIEEAMLIFPTTQKSVLGYPYYHFYNLFKMQQWSTLVVVGYSFRDEPVNSAIFENLQRNQDSKVVVINPNPNVVDNLTNNTQSEVLNRIIPIEGKLGEDWASRRLELALSVRSRKRFNERLPGIESNERI
jgi:NAD-dependent SIR2 family protein deacetylase